MFEGLASIEVGQQGQPLGQVTAIAALVHVPVLVQDLDEAAHDEGEDGHPDQHDEGSHDFLLGVHGVEVAEADCGEGRDREIPDDHQSV